MGRASLLDGRVAIVTGGGSGIGRAIALGFATEGAIVHIVDLNEASASSASGEIEKAGGSGFAYPADVRDFAAMQAIVDRVARTSGRLDILVTSAGCFYSRSIEETTEEQWDHQADLNAKATFFCIKAVIPRMKSQRYGKIVTIGSIAGIVAFPNSAAYCASKGGVANLTRAVSCEVAEFGINVNCLAPGNIATPMNAHLRAPPGSEAWTARLRAGTPAKVGFYEPEDMVGTAVYLASDLSGPIHGSVIAVDGGWCAW